jgi:hypothetical protein
VATLTDGVFDTIKACTSLPAKVFGTIGEKIMEHMPNLPGQDSVHCSNTMKYAVVNIHLKFF